MKLRYSNLLAEEVVGRQWESTRGTRRVVRQVGDKIEIAWEGKEAGQTGNIILPVNELEREIEFDTRKLGFNQQQREKNIALAAAEAERTKYLNAYLATLPPMRAGKAKKSLDVSIRHNGRPDTRQVVIEQMVDQGAKVITTAKGERRLQLPSEAYLGEDQITKGGMDYAAWLVDNKQAISATQPSSAASAPPFPVGKQAQLVVMIETETSN